MRSVPLTQATALCDVGMVRCRECGGYANEHATHSPCTLTGVVKAGYARACRLRVPRGQAPPEPHRCIVCGADISHIPNGRYCGYGCKWKRANALRYPRNMPGAEKASVAEDSVNGFPLVERQTREKG